MVRIRKGFLWQTRKKQQKKKETSQKWNENRIFKCRPSDSYRYLSEYKIFCSKIDKFLRVDNPDRLYLWFPLNRTSKGKKEFHFLCVRPRALACHSSTVSKTAYICMYKVQTTHRRSVVYRRTDQSFGWTRSTGSSVWARALNRCKSGIISQ